jgi:thiol-disulfide isomerase/thioredoxin
MLVSDLARPLRRALRASVVLGRCLSPSRARSVLSAGALLAVGLAAGYCLSVLAGRPWGSPDDHRPRRPAAVAMPGAAAPYVIESEPLAPGSELPPLTSSWLNGPSPEQVLPAGHGVVVVDVWAGWCPYCRAEAPGLLRAYQKYRDRGVTFVSITPDARPSAEQFMSDFELPWPCLYEAPDETLRALGALHRIGPNRSVPPTLYVVGADGKVAWSDRQARYRHEDVDASVRHLEKAIEEALGKGDSDSPMNDG